jgi:pimeloyl-ACP methyl ester carboxylesterase
VSNTANPDAVTEAGERKKLVPIVFVPGTMGTRLATNDGTLVWNPTGEGLLSGPAGGVNCPGPQALDAELIGQIDSPLKPVGLFKKDNKEDMFSLPGGIMRYPSQYWGYAQSVRYFFSAIPEFYDTLLFKLSRSPAGDGDLFTDLSELGYEPRVYVAGYDWRHPCADAAVNFVSPVVQEALKDCDAEQVILVAHSMGGPVARHYCKYPGKGLVRGLILITSPLAGAMKAYSWIKKGFASDDGAMFGMRIAFFRQLKNWSSITFCRNIPSMYEMLPTRAFAQNFKNWLEFDKEDNQTGYAYDAAPGEFPVPTQYEDATDPYGLTQDPFAGVGDDESNRVRWAKYVANAEQFQFNLTVPGIAAEGEVRKIYLPENTYIIYSQGLPTKTSGRLKRYGEIQFNADTGSVTYEPNWLLEGTPDHSNLVPLIGIINFAKRVRLEIPLEVDTPTTGDGTVPGASALPWAGVLSVQPREAVLLEGSDEELFEHSKMPRNPEVTSTVRRWVVEMLTESK